MIIVGYKLGKANRPGKIKTFLRTVGTLDIPSDTIPFPKEIKPTTRDIGLSDAQIAEKIQLAVAQIQDTMDAALMAGLIVEPSFNQVENRQTPWGVRIDSFVCHVRTYRRLT